MKNLLILILALMACACNGTKSQNKETATIAADSIPHYGGIYAFGDTLQHERAYGKAYIYPENDSTLIFYVFISNGAPSYNSGSIDGKISVHNGKATFRTRFGDAETECVLYFDFRGDTLTIVQKNDECQCGFGNGVYLEDEFSRITSEIPSYFVTITNDKVYFKEWEAMGTEDVETPYPGIDSRFIDLFPDLVLGQEHERGKLIPQEMIDEFLPDVPEMFGNDVQSKFYATGKIMDYRGMNLFILDHEGTRENEGTYDNHTDSIRFVLRYNKNNQPVATMTEDGNLPRTIDYIQSRYYGEGGEESLHSYFDQDTTLLSVQQASNFDISTDYQFPLISHKEYRWRIGDEGTIEITKLELSSPFYDRACLKKEKWYTETDEMECQRHYPTIKSQCPLLTFYNNEVSEIRILRFYLKRIGDELFPVFEVSDSEDTIDQYIVGKPDENIQQSDVPSVSSIFKSPVIIKTSDGDVEWFPGKGHIKLKEQ